MVSIPLGIASAILGHLVLGYAISFVSIFRMVALAGGAVNSSVVLVDRFNKQRDLGQTPEVAAASASHRRFRPVAITTLTTALGLGPLLFETSPQAQFLIPMGVSLGFGILVSGLMVIFVPPAVTLIVEDLRSLLERSPVAKPSSPASPKAIRIPRHLAHADIVVARASSQASDWQLPFPGQLVMACQGVLRARADRKDYAANVKDRRDDADRAGC